MDPMAKGLRFRIRRVALKVAEQHHHIHEILHDFDRALADGDRQRVSEVFESYRRALEAHFSLEEQVFFPGLHGLHPEQSAELDALSEDHESFAGELDRLAEKLLHGRVESFTRAFRDLVTDLGQHELREEQMLRRLSDLGGGDQKGPGESPSPSSSGVGSSS